MQQIMTTMETGAHAPAIAAVPRFNIYNAAHKGLRAFLCEAMVAVGRMDDADEREMSVTLTNVRTLLKFCQTHLHKENHFIHPAMEARKPGSASGIAREHLEHEQAFQDIERAICAVENGHGAERSAAAAGLYAALACFVADNLRHMHTEETANNAVLHTAYSDAELIALNRDLVASIPPGQQRAFLRWIVPSLTPRERARMLAEMKKSLPEDVFADLLAMLRAHLDDHGWRKLRVALDR